MCKCFPDIDIGKCTGGNVRGCHLEANHAGLFHADQAGIHNGAIVQVIDVSCLGQEHSVQVTGLEVGVTGGFLRVEVHIQLVVVGLIAPVKVVANQSILDGFFPAGLIGLTVACQLIGASAIEPTVAGIGLAGFLIEDHAAGVGEHISEGCIVAVHSQDYGVVIFRLGVIHIQPGVHGCGTGHLHHVLQGEQDVVSGQIVAVGELHALAELNGHGAVVICKLNGLGQLGHHVAFRVYGPQGLAHCVNQEAAGVRLKVGCGVKGGGVGVGAIPEHLGAGGLGLLSSGGFVSSGVILCCGLSSGSSRSIASGCGRGSRGSSASASCHTEQHSQAEHGCKYFFHVSYPS